MKGHSASLRVHLLKQFNEDFAADLQDRLDKRIVLTAGSEIPSAANYHVLIAGVPEHKHLQASPNLHTVVIPWTGLSTKAREALLSFPHLAIHNIHHADIPTAEMAMALLLAAAKDLVPTDRRFRKLDWSPRYQPSKALLLAGRNALILGYGAIGQKIARMCQAMGMNVNAIRRTRGRDQEDVPTFTTESFAELLPETHAFFIAVPLTPETRGMIAAEELSLLPDDAIVVNIARGPIIDEEALFRELESGRLRAGLDVWFQYPPNGVKPAPCEPSAFPFHQLDNVVMTPHLAGHSTRTREYRVSQLADLLNAMTAGNPLPNRVDLEKGY